MNDSYISTRQILALSNRVEKAIQTDATTKLRKVLQDMTESGSVGILVVGAGGSYSAAVFAAHVLEEWLSYGSGNYFVEAVTPQTALMKMDCKYDLVIGISYSGKSPDIVAVSNECSYRYIPFLLITGAKLESLNNTYDLEEGMIVSYYNSDDDTGRERGMISMASTLIPCMIFYDACECGDAMQPSHVERLEEAKNRIEELNNNGTFKILARSLKNHPSVHILYDYFQYPLMCDLESKLTEAGIACVTLHEKKNFSHGRTNILLCQNFGMIINLAVYAFAYGEDIEKNFLSMMSGESSVDYLNGYEKKLASFLKEVCKEKQSVYYEIRSIYGTENTWNLNYMCQLPYWLTYLGEALNVDVSMPVNPIPRLTNELYRYEGSF